MVLPFKCLIIEQDGVDLPDATEYDLKASTLPFSNSGNGFTSTDAQAAIVEAKTIGVTTPRFSIVTIFNATINNGQWLGYVSAIPGDTVPIVIPIACTLREITFSFGGSNVDGKFNLYKNGITAGDIVYTVQFTNDNVFKIASGINLSLVAGDLIRGRWVDEGDNPSDLAITYYPQATI